MSTYIRFGDDHYVAVNESWDEVRAADRRRRSGEAAAVRSDPDRRGADAAQRQRGANDHRRQEQGRALATVSGEPETSARDPRIVSGNDYGNSDSQWKRVDWRARRRSVELPGATGQLRRDRRGRAAALHPRPLRLLAELAREPAPLRRRAAGDRARPAGLRLQPDALLGDRDAHLRPADPRLLREARAARGRRWSATRWAASSRSRRWPPSRSSFARLVLVSAAGILNTWNPEERATAPPTPGRNSAR